MIGDEDRRGTRRPNRASRRAAGAWLARWLCLSLAVAAVACGGAQRGGPVDYEVEARRVGRAVHIDVVGTRLAAGKQRGFEDPSRWRIDVRAGGKRLQRVVNGSTRVKREMVDGGRRWRIDVEFSVAYALTQPAKTITVRLKPPGGPARTLTVPIAGS